MKADTIFITLERSGSADNHSGKRNELLIGYDIKIIKQLSLL